MNVTPESLEERGFYLMPISEAQPLFTHPRCEDNLVFLLADDSTLSVMRSWDVPELLFKIHTLAALEQFMSCVDFGKPL